MSDGRKNQPLSEEIDINDPKLRELLRIVMPEMADLLSGSEITAS